MATRQAPRVTLLKGASVYLYPGRGVGDAKAAKLPKAAALFTDLASAWHEHPDVGERVKEGVDRDFDAAALARAVAALEVGAWKGTPSPDDAAALWRALEPTWERAWYGTPAILTAGKRLGEKFALWTLAVGGAGFAMEGLRATWSRGPGVEPASPEIDHAFWYLERQFAGFSAVRALRERLATVPDAAYASAVAAGRAMTAGLPTHLQAAVAFLLPTERDLADAAMTQTEAYKAPYKAVPSKLNLAPVEPDCWPSYVAFLAWSLLGEEDFARTRARRFFGGASAWAVACATLHPKFLTDYDARELVRHKLAALG